MSAIECVNKSCVSHVNGPVKGIRFHERPYMENGKYVHRLKCQDCGRTFICRNWKHVCKKRGPKIKIIMKKRSEFIKDSHFLFVRLIVEICPFLKMDFYECASLVAGMEKRKIIDILSRGRGGINEKTCLLAFQALKELAFDEIENVEKMNDPGKAIARKTYLFENLQKAADLTAKILAG